MNLSELLGLPKPDLSSLLGVAKQSLEDLLGVKKPTAKLDWGGEVKTQPAMMTDMGVVPTSMALGMGYTPTGKSATGKELAIGMASMANPEIAGTGMLATRLPGAGIAEGIGKATGKAKALLSTKTASKIPAKMDNMIDPKKYKTVDEFVKAKTKYFHGTRAKFDKFAFAKEGQAVGGKETKTAMFFDINPKNALEFGKRSRPPEIDIIEAAIKKEKDWNKLEALKEKLKNYTGIGDSHYFNTNKGVDVKGVHIDTSAYKIVDFKGSNYDYPTVKQAIDEAKKNNIPGVIFKDMIDDEVSNIPSTQVAVINLDTIKTKSQLIDIYNKAHGKN